jgi:hypothetical protein
MAINFFLFENITSLLFELHSLSWILLSGTCVQHGPQHIGATRHSVLTPSFSLVYESLYCDQQSHSFLMLGFVHLPCIHCKTAALK